MAFEVMKRFFKYVIFVLVFILGTYINYLIQKSADISPNIFTTVVPSIIASVSAWRYARRKKNTRKL